MSPLKDRIKSNTTINERGCWVWQRHITPNGYGVISVNGKSSSAHRTSYTLFKGRIPEGFQIDHLCKVRSCVNPKHLEAVTAKENVRRSNSYAQQEASRTHCKYGHEFTPNNIYKASQGNGRNCRTCMRNRTKQRYAMKKIVVTGVLGYVC